MKKKFSTNTVSEKRVGYSRAVVVDDKRAYVAGTTSSSEDGMVVGKSVGEQSEYVLERIKSVLEQADFSLEDVVMVRVYLVAMDQLPEFDGVFKQYFGDVNPTCTLVGIAKLVEPEMLVEIEVVAEK